MRGAFYPGLFCFIIVCCSGLEEKYRSHRLTHQVPGEDSLMPLLPGQGFNHVTWQAKGHCVDLSLIKTQSGSPQGYSAEFKLFEVSSISDLREGLQIGASASFQGTLFGHISSRFSFAQSIKKKSNSRYVLIHIRVSNQLRLAQDYVLKKSVLESSSYLNPKEFLHHCGTQFVHGIRTGGEFYMVLEFDRLDHERHLNLHGKLGGKGIGWKSIATFSQDLRRLDHNLRVNISMHRVGGSGLMPRIKAVSDLISEYPKIIDQLRQFPVTIELLTKDYSGVKPFRAVSDVYVLKHQERIVNQLAKNRDWAMESLNTLHDVMRRSRDLMDKNRSAKFKTYQKYLKEYMQEQHRSASKCFEDPILHCSLPKKDRIIMSLNFESTRGSGKLGIDKQYWYDEEGHLCRYEFDGECLAKIHGRCTIYGRLFQKKVCQ